VGVILTMHQSQWSPAFRNFRSGRNGGTKICEGIGMPDWLYPGTRPGVQPDAAKCEFFQDAQRTGVPVAPQDGFIEAWRVLAARYASTAAVIGADQLNEPGWSDGCKVRSGALTGFFERVGRAVYAANPRLLLIVEDGTYTYYAARGFNMATRPNLPNLVYSWHYYPPDFTRTRVGKGHVTGRDSLLAHVARARSWNAPLWLGEMNAFNYGYNEPARWTDPDWQADTQALLALCKQYRVGWNFYAFELGQGASIIDPRTRAPKADLLALLRAGM
jgi:hypothetical protein